MKEECDVNNNFKTKDYFSENMKEIRIKLWNNKNNLVLLDRVDYLVWKISDEKLVSLYKKFDRMDLNNFKEKDKLNYIKFKIWFEVYERDLK